MSYGVIFHSMDGTNAVKQQVIDNGVETPLNANVFTKEYCTFLGWSTEPFGNVTYEDEEEVLDIAPNGSVIALYAVWQKELVNGHKYILNPMRAAASGTLDGDTTLTEDYGMATDYANQTLHIYSVDTLGSAGEKTITANGDYDASDDSWGGYSKVHVEVPVPQYANLDNQRF